MKHLLLPLSALCGALFATLSAAPSARAQAPVTTWAQSYGVGNYEPDGTATDPNTVYPSSGYDLATGIAPMPDGGVVICGRLDLPETNVNRGHAVIYNGSAALVRYAPNGTILWQQALRQRNDLANPGYQTQLVATGAAFQVLTDAQGNIFAYSYQGDPLSTASYAAVTKFSPDGALIWQNGFGGDEFTDGGNPPKIQAAGVYNGDPAYPDRSFSLTADGGVIVGSADAGNGVSFPFYAKFNADGSLGVHRPFNNVGQYPSFRVTCQSVDGSRIIASLRTTGTVLLMDAASGNLLAERTFHSDAGVLNYPADEIVRALPLADGGFLLLGQDIGQYGQGLTLHRVDANLVPRWEKVYANITGTNLAPTSDGGYLLTGLTPGDISSTTGPTTDVLLLKVDANGNPVFARGIGGPKNEGFNDTQGGQVPVASAVQTTDGGYAFTVSSFSYAVDVLAYPDFWTVKTDANGHVLNFPGRQNDLDPATFQAHDNTIASEITSTYDGSYPMNYVGTAATGTFGVILENLAANTGINKPTVLVQAAPTVSYNHPLFFTGEAPLGNGVYYLSFPGGNPFGYYSYLADPHYVYHFDLGYEYVFDANDRHSGVYLYDFKSGGFFYTSPSFPFPYLYDFTLNSTLYYYPDPNNPGRYNTNGIRYFYEFANGQIISK